MKGLRAMVLIWVIFGIWSVSPVHAGLNEWTMIWPSLTQITHLVIDPSMPATLYAGTDVGVMKSKDGGDNWFAVNSGLNGRPISSLAIDALTPTILYAGTNAGVFKSTDGGDNWFAVDNGLPKTADEGVIVVVTALAVDPSTPTTLYAGTNSVGVYKSTDGGANWVAANNGLPATVISSFWKVTINTLVIDPSTPTSLYAGTSYAGVFKSIDGGASWFNVYGGVPLEIGQLYTIDILVIDPSSPTTLYAGYEGNSQRPAGVIKSTDGGANWNEMNNGLPESTYGTVPTMAVDPSTPTTLYVAIIYGLFKSVDGGANWVAANTGMPNYVAVSLVIDPSTPATLYAGVRAEYGVYKSTDGGASWFAANSGLPGTYLTTLAIDPLTPTTMYAGESAGLVFKSTDGGASWFAANSGLPGTYLTTLAIDPLTPTTVYAGAWAGLVFKSTDGGASWFAANSGLNMGLVFELAIDALTPTIIYAGALGGVFKSTDGGNSWFAVNGRPIWSLAIDPLTPTILYAGTNAGVFKSTDGGDNWFAVDNGLPKTADEGVIVVVTALAVDPSTPTTLYAGTNSVGVYKSTDGGANWVAANNGLPLITVWYPLNQDPALENIPPYPVTFFAEIRALAIDPSSHNTLYAGIQDQGVFKSVDGGASWTEMNTALTHLDVVALAIDPSTPTILYAGTSHGVFKYEASADSIVASSGGGNSDSGCFIGALLY